MGTLRSGDAAASPLPATLCQRRLYLTNNLLPKSDEIKNAIEPNMLAGNVSDEKSLISVIIAKRDSPTTW
jgi:hypothetical protein